MKPHKSGTVPRQTARLRSEKISRHISAHKRIIILLLRLIKRSISTPFRLITFHGKCQASSKLNSSNSYTGKKQHRTLKCHTCRISTSHAVLLSSSRIVSAGAKDESHGHRVLLFRIIESRVLHNAL